MSGLTFAATNNLFARLELKRCYPCRRSTCIRRWQGDAWVEDRGVIDLQVTDLITHTQEKLARLKIRKYADLQKINYKLVGFSPELKELRKPLRQFLMQKLYHHYRVVRMSVKAKRFIRELFLEYLSRPQQLPVEIGRRVAKEGVQRVVCDYIAGMTDRYALDEYKKLFNPYEKV